MRAQFQRQRAVRQERAIEVECPVLHTAESRIGGNDVTELTWLDRLRTTLLALTNRNTIDK
jgi:hypothetical protein